MAKEESIMKLIKDMPSELPQFIQNNRALIDEFLGVNHLQYLLIHHKGNLATLLKDKEKMDQEEIFEIFAFIDKMNENINSRLEIYNFLDTM